MKQSKKQVRAKGNIYARKDRPFGIQHIRQMTESLQNYYGLRKSPLSEAQMEDPVTTMQLYSIWCDKGGKALGLGLKSLLCCLRAIWPGEDHFWASVSRQ